MLSLRTFRDGRTNCGGRGDKMGFDLWGDDPGDEVGEAEQNPYLANPVKAMQLIASLLPQKHAHTNDERKFAQLDDLLDRQIVRTLKNVDGIDIFETERELKEISDQYMEYQKVRVLEGRTVIGIGGRFSAGKSSFINSLLENEGNVHLFLPENQSETTSIPTYVIGGTENTIAAYLKNGDRVLLDTDAMDALTHAFYETYRIGFSRFVSNLVVEGAHFPALFTDRIAFLDTPGYNKAHGTTREKLSDGFLSQQQLRAADYLIWLVGSDNGTIPQSDIDFIKELELQKSVLVIFNKADKLTEGQLRGILEEAENVLRGDHIKYYGITAYSSRDRKEYFGKTLIQDFFDEAIHYSNQKENIEQRWKNIANRLSEKFSCAIRECQNSKKALGHTISMAEDLRAIHSLVNAYHVSLEECRRLETEGKAFRNRIAEVNKLMRTLNGKG